MIIGIFTRTIRSWHLGLSLSQELTVKMLERALATQAPLLAVALGDGCALVGGAGDGLGATVGLDTTTGLLGRREAVGAEGAAEQAQQIASRKAPMIGLITHRRMARILAKA